MMDYQLADFAVGQRVETHPATDAWIFGDRFGTVVLVGRSKVTVHLDRSGRRLRFSPHNLLPA